ncbi:MAG TPA: hypothetical protein VG734_03430 [Lacunisphaera sp.]|nr:hypothetical protein [Lacunisphaera sp.]
MRHRTKVEYDKLGFGLAVVFAGLSVTWAGRQFRTLQDMLGPEFSLGKPEATYQAEGWPEVAAAGREWVAPIPQVRGNGWLYEVFAPPLLAYDKTKGAFALATARPSVERVGLTEGPELLQVQRQPYRLQLVGYFTSADGYLAAFASPLQPDTLLARPGGRFEELGLVFRRFEMRKVAVGRNEAGPVSEVTGVAVLYDERAGTEVELDSRTRRFTDTALAVIRLPGVRGQTRELIEGDSLSFAGATYRVTRIQFAPPEVVIIENAPGLSNPEEKTLRPAAPLADAPVRPDPVSATAATLAHSEAGYPAP